ncbi:Trk system potassium transporter TrkA [candidate division KSB1 bacterium]|nr:Trk system potassium transporter TrkA [candidate division KSB1 bacterium]
MKVIVIGMGEVGKYIASVLSKEKHDVIILDANAAALAKAEEMMDVMALHGHGASIKTLRQAKVEEADLVLGVTGRDEINLLAAITAKQLGAKRTVARVSNRDYLGDADRGFYHNLLGIDLAISVQILVANEIKKLIKSIGAVAIEDFADNRVEMMQIAVEEELAVVKKPLRDIDLPDDCLVAAILRNENVIIPSGADEIWPGDEVFLIGTIENIPRLEKMFGKKREHGIRKVVIVGGGDVGFSVAKLLERESIDVILIEQNGERCEELSQKLHHAVIINGDGTDIGLLREEKMEHCDVFVAVSGNDEENLASGLLAKNLGAKRIVVLVDKPDYVPLYELLGIDATVTPSLFAANQILKYVREGEVVAVSMLEEGKAEILEIVPSPGSPIVNQPLREVNFPRGAVIAAVAREDGVFVPKGKDVIKAGNNVVVFTTPKVRPAVERLFRKKLFSFS